MLAAWKKSYGQTRQHIKKQRHYFADKGPSSQSYGFSSSHSWTIRKAENWKIDAFEVKYWRKLLRVPWTGKWFNQSILKEISPEYSLEGLMLRLNLQYFGHLCKELTHWKNLDAGQDWRQEKGMIRDEMVGWHHWLDGHESEQAPGVSEGQGSLACCSPWCFKELDTTEQLNYTGSSLLGRLLIAAASLVVQHRL